jgi:hypothetical protein
MKEKRLKRKLILTKQNKSFEVVKSLIFFVMVGTFQNEIHIALFVVGEISCQLHRSLQE